MISLVFAVALMAGAPAAAEPASQPATTSTAPAKAEKPKPTDVVCKKEAVVGSRMKSRICMTQAEWDARRMQDRQDLDRGQTVKPLTF